MKNDLINRLYLFAKIYASNPTRDNINCIKNTRQIRTILPRIFICY